MKKPFFTTLGLIMIMTLTSKAQVLFNLSYDKVQDWYVLSIIPLQTYVLPESLTGSAQVTIKTLTGKFHPIDLKSLYPGLEWEFNSDAKAPKEAPDFDYLSFALKNPGLLHLPYREGVEIPLFAFRNEFGCNGPVALVDNLKDPFMAPNSQNVNIGNTIVILGYGAHAYAGIKGDGIVDCLTTFTHDVAGKIGKFDLYPIPAEKEIFLEFNWNGERETVMAEIVDELGRTLSRSSLDFEPGKNLHVFDIRNLAAANYFINLKGKGWTETLEKFQKVRF